MLLKNVQTLFLCTYIMYANIIVTTTAQRFSFKMIFFYTEFCSCRRTYLYKLKYMTNVCVCICVSRPGELISVAQLALRPAAPAPHFCVQRWQPISSLVQCCSLVLTSRRWPAGMRPPSLWRPWKENTQFNGNILVTVLFQRNVLSPNGYIWETVKNANALCLSYVTTDTTNRERGQCVP